ncbi:hypothetical protein BC835DRAFT_1305936 [Cytidiella melzeri]|nr:hypothetical protein BC835DRAFT_1305936 [Cytidiella melzeri]
MKLSYLLAALFLSNFVLGSAVPVSVRALNDVFPGFDYPLPVETQAEQHAHEGDPSPTHTTKTPIAVVTSSSPSEKSKDTSTQSRQQSTTSGTSSSPVINTPTASLSSGTASSTNQPSSTISNIAASTPTATSTPPPAEEQTSSRGSQEWKVVGVAVIAFSSVAAILLLSVFFDHWWGFIRDLFWKKKRKDNVEELIPDWEAASWEIRVGGDRHRYPTIPPAALTKEEEFGHSKAHTLTSVENVAGIGSGRKVEGYSNITPRPEYQHGSPWTRGLGLSPLPPVAQSHVQRPPGLPGHTLRRQDSNPFEPKMNPPSPAFTDPYGGIAE